MKDNKNMEAVILESATELFLKKGFAATSTTEISKHAGCNQALVHYYFRTKDKLFEAIFQTKINMFVESLLQSTPDEESFFDRLAHKIGRHFDLLSKNPKLPGLLFSEIATNPQRIVSIRNAVSDGPQKVLQSLDTDLQNEIAKGTVRQMSVMDLLLYIVSLNVMPFLIEEPFKMITKLSDEEYRVFRAQRREENIKLILKGIKP